MHECVWEDEDGEMERERHRYRDEMRRAKLVSEYLSRLPDSVSAHACLSLWLLCVGGGSCMCDLLSYESSGS